MAQWILTGGCLRPGSRSVTIQVDCFPLVRTSYPHLQWDPSGGTCRSIGNLNPISEFNEQCDAVLLTACGAELQPNNFTTAEEKC